MSDPAQHPEILRFGRAVDRGDVDRFQADNFDRWRLGTKCNNDPALRAAADALWARLQAAGGPRAPKPPVVVAPAATGRRQGQPMSGGRPGEPPGASPASAKVLGAPFHNPYTFLPFGKQPRRGYPTPLSMDEIERDRFTGVVELEIETLSPLLTCSPVPHDKEADHKRYKALCIGNDVIVPATGVRGALRSLMSILTGGTLGYLDEEVWLCQGRDLNLGPAGVHSPAGTPTQVFLAEVVTPGTTTRPGTLRLGRTKLISADLLERKTGPLPRPVSGKAAKSLMVDEDGNPSAAGGAGGWRVKLSGRPVNPKGKREGMLLADGKEIKDVGPELWAAYQGRNAHGDHPELRKGDLVWLSLKPGRTEIRSAADIESLQWARWGRKGERLLDLVSSKHRAMLPDSINPDGMVDEVTDLFGQVPREDLVREAFRDRNGASDTMPGPAGPFAARVRPQNLVFCDAAGDGLLKSVPLAPLAPPHPGCAAFYRDQDEPTLVANGRTGLRGYKVYRNAMQRGDAAPWHFAQQGVYDERGHLKPDQQKVNKTVDLLKEGRRGHLRIACRSLTGREVALVLAACSVDWRLGGGKPLGLGHCRVTRVRLMDETGTELAAMSRDGNQPASLPPKYAKHIDKDLANRMALWQASQEPVPHLRYPRAVVENRNKKNRGGHVWFGRHANPRKVIAGDGLPSGLEVMYVTGDLATKSGRRSISPQVLPRFMVDEPLGDVLYGYDLFLGQGEEWSEQTSNRQTFVKKLEPFDPTKHARQQDKSGGPQGQTGKSRSADRAER